jgi:hypothetical protein
VRYVSVESQDYHEGIDIDEACDAEVSYDQEESSWMMTGVMV